MFLRKNLAQESSVLLHISDGSGDTDSGKLDFNHI